MRLSFLFVPNPPDNSSQVMIDDLTDEPEYDQGDEPVEEADWPKCACPFCYCSVRTKDGICDMCAGGGHQG